MSLGSDWSSGFSNGAAAVNSGLANARQMLQWKEEQDRKRKLEELARENAGIGRTRTVQKDVEYPYNDQETRQWTPDTDPAFTANTAQAYRDFGEEGLRSLEGSYGMPANTIRHHYDTGTYGLGRVPAVEQGFDTETDVVSPHGSWKVRLDERQPGGSLPPLRDAYTTDGYKQGITKLVPKTGIAQVATTEQVPASERYAQMAQNAAARGLYAEAEKYSLLADKTAIDEEKLGWDRKRFGWDEADRGDVLQERKLRMDQVRQQLELGQITIDGKKRDEVIKTELGKLAKVGSWDALVKLADPDANDGIEVTYQEVQMGKGKGVLLMYGDKPLFPQPFSSLDDAKKMIQQGITGNPDLYYAFKTAEDDRALKNAQTQSEIDKNNAMANNYNAEAWHTRAGKPGAGGLAAGKLPDAVKVQVSSINADIGRLQAQYTAAVAAGDKAAAATILKNMDTAAATRDSLIAPYFEGGRTTPQVGADFAPPPRPGSQPPRAAADAGKVAPPAKQMSLEELATAQRRLSSAKKELDSVDGNWIMPETNPALARQLREEIKQLEEALRAHRRAGRGLGN